MRELALHESCCFLEIFLEPVDNQMHEKMERLPIEIADEPLHLLVLVLYGPVRAACTMGHQPVKEMLVMLVQFLVQKPCDDHSSDQHE